MPDWAQVAAQHRAQQAARRDAEATELGPKWAGLTDELRRRVLACDATGLLQSMQDGTLTSEQVVLVYTERAYNIGCLQLNAVTETFFLSAYEAARASDARRARNAPIHELEGLPITLKDCFEMQGTYATVGISSRVIHPGLNHDEDGLMTSILRKAGAIPIAKTNVPQGLLETDTRNLLFGTTANPWDLTRSPGGSSGGESAMVSAQCSPLGFGTDIGGSVRIPAACCGLYSFKCTQGRLSTKGLAMQEGPGQETVLSMPGPIARSVDDCVLALKVWLGEAMWRGDPSYTPPVPFRDALYTGTEKLRVAVLHHVPGESKIPPSPAVTRAVQEAARVFRAAGVAVVEFKCEEGIFDKLDAIHSSALIVADEVQWLNDALDGEEVLAPFLKDLRWGENLKRSDKRDYVNLLQAERRQLRDKLVGYYDELGVDVLLCPVGRLPAGLSGDNYGWFTGWVNAVGHPAGVVPVARVETEEAKDKSHPVGMPLTVQLVGRMWEDENVLRSMKVLEAAFPIVFPDSTLSNPVRLSASSSPSKL